MLLGDCLDHFIEGRRWKTLPGKASPCESQPRPQGAPEEGGGHRAEREQARLRDARVSTGLKKNLTTSYVRPKGKAAEHG